MIKGLKYQHISISVTFYPIPAVYRVVQLAGAGVELGGDRCRTVVDLIERPRQELQDLLAGLQHQQRELCLSVSSVSHCNALNFLLTWRLKLF